MRFGLDAVPVILSLKWVTLRYFTEGWDTFFREEFVSLGMVSALVGLVDLILGHSLSCFVTHVALLILVRRIQAGGMCSSSKRLDGQTIVVTGCNVGIGQETARALSHRGAKVVMACRDTHMAEKVATEITKETGGELVVMKLDLASLASVRAFAADLKAKESRIHMLINNAGVMFCPYMKTEDGFEMQMGTNHLGHFLLTSLLLPLLTHSEPARIITVSSLGHIGGTIPFEDMNLEKKYSRFEAYGNSKLANILFTRQLAKRLKGTNIQVFSLHPGSVQSNLARHMFSKEWLPTGRLSSLLIKTTVEGAQTTLYCALEAQQQEPYYYSDCNIGAVIKAARDDALAEKLWQVSEEMVGLSKPESSSGSKIKE